jgi:hypothetical protein
LVPAAYYANGGWGGNKQGLGFGLNRPSRTHGIGYPNDTIVRQDLVSTSDSIGNSSISEIENYEIAKV